MPSVVYVSFRCWGVVFRVAPIERVAWSDQVRGLSIAHTPANGIGIYLLLDMVDETTTRLGRVQSKSRRIIPLPGAACYSVFLVAALPAPGVASPQVSPYPFVFGREHADRGHPAYPARAPPARPAEPARSAPSHPPARPAHPAPPRPLSIYYPPGWLARGVSPLRARVSPQTLHYIAYSAHEIPPASHQTLYHTTHTHANVVHSTQVPRVPFPSHSSRSLCSLSAAPPRWRRRRRRS
jgi:hypothetical protein